MRLPLCLLSALCTGFVLGPQAPAAQILTIDFEQGADLSKYPRLGLDKTDAKVVERGPDGKGHCLRIRNPRPATGCALILRGPIDVKKNLILSFHHREEIEEGYEGAYLGMSWFVGKKQGFWCSDKFTGEWRLAQVQIGKLKGSWGIDMKRGLVLSRVHLYGRVKEKTKVRTATKARITVWFDNIQLYTGHPKRSLAERTRDSYSNPPMLNWPKAEEEAAQKLQYSLDASFPHDASVTVDVKRNFYMPAEPMKPGTWYWRVWSSSELSEGWSDVERVIILPEAHRFVTKPANEDALAKKPHPRLLPFAKIDQPELTAQRKAQLKKSAKRIRETPTSTYRAVPGNVSAAEKEYPGPDGARVVLGRTGVQVHPGPHVKGDPRWPTWIDWYGRVAGRITGGTGGRLERIAQYAMLTQDPEVIQRAKEMAIMACMWDPNAGSAMGRGDIGAHHLLRGLCWCYDACRDHMTPAERELLKNIIVVRCNQFYRHLNPLRSGTETNNHAWLRAYGVATAGIALLGDHDKAGEWVEYVRQLYVGRFLCSLGFQGDCNEGVSYWGYGQYFIIPYADMMKSVCGIDLYKQPWLHCTARSIMYCAPPNAWAVSFADNGMPNHGIRGPTQTHRIRQLALRTRDPYALWYCGERQTIDGITPRPPVDLTPSIHFRHVGYVMFNTSLVDGRDGVTVAMHSVPYYAGHLHADQNCFVIHAYGDKLAIDGGYYDYWGSPHFKAYSETTLAHNTLLVNGEGQAVRKMGADGHVTAYFDSIGYGYTVGDASDPDIYGGLLKQFDRRILFIKPGFVVVHDLVASAKGPAKYDWMLHALAPIKTDKDAKSFQIERETAALRGRFFSPAHVALKVTRGFPVEPVNRYSTDPVPPEKYFPEWHLYATPTRPAIEDEFLAAMQIQRLGADGGPVAEIEQHEAHNAHAVRFACDGQTHLVLFRKRNAEGLIGCAGLETDGQAAAIELASDGEIKRAFAAKAKFLRYKSQTLFESPVSKDWAFLDKPDVKSGPIEGAWAMVNDKRSELQGYQRRLPDYMLRYWWGQIELPRRDRYQIAIDGWPGKAPPRVRLDKRTVELGAGRAAAVWLAEGPHTLSMAGKATLDVRKVETNGRGPTPFSVTFTGQGVRLVPTKMLPERFAPTKGSVIVEAERTSAEGKIKGKLADKVGASGGKAHCCWDTQGQWAEWQFDIAAAGDYELLIRGASVHSMILRELGLDGRPLLPGVGVIRLTKTGGWCRTTDDWRYFLVVDASGRAARIHLEAGKHALRMAQLGGSMNVDLFAWQPAQ